MIFQYLPEPIDDLLSVLGYWDLMLSGFIMTMWLYGIALLMGFIIGLFFAILRQYGGFILSRIATAYIEVIRGTPLLAQLFLFYFLPYSLRIPIGKWNYGINFVLFGKDVSVILFNHRVLVGIITLSINSSAYQAEYFRGAILSIGTEQLIAAQSLGMSRLSGIRHIILPQALRRVIPAWSNEAAYLPKYTVVVYFIGVLELFAQAHNIVAYTFVSLLTYIIVAIIFLVLITTISKGLDYIYKRTSIPGL